MSSLYLIYPDHLIFGQMFAHDPTENRNKAQSQEMSESEGLMSDSFLVNDPNHADNADNAHGDENQESEFSSMNLQVETKERNNKNGSYETDLETEEEFPDERIRHSHRKVKGEEVEELRQVSNHSNLISTRLLHLDLKGAPPKVSYLKEVNVDIHIHICYRICPSFNLLKFRQSGSHF
jgi:hypothetical protein